MSGRIKGITVKIDGNTTDLQKSLSEVESKLRKTQSSLKDVEKLLKLDPKNTELLTQKQVLLKKAVDDTKDKLKQLEKAQKEMDAKNVDKNSEQYQALQREIIATEQDLKKAQKALDDFDAEMSESVEVTKKAGMSLEDFSAGAQKVSDKTRALSAGAAALGTAFVGMAVNAGKTADDLLTLSRNTGFSVEELQKMQYASDLVDVSMDQMTGSVQKLTKQMASGNDAFKTLGVSITDENGNMRDAVDVWYESLEALSKVENGTERDQIAMELFGRSAMEMSGIVDDGGASLRQLGQDAEDMGLILSEDAVGAAAEFNDAIDTLKAQTSQAFFEAGAALSDSLLPMLGDLAQTISDVLVWFSDLDGNTQMFILTILALVAAISPIAGLIAGITTIAGALAAVTAPMAATFLGIAAAIGVVIAIGVVLYENLDTIKEKGKQLMEALVNAWNTILQTITTAASNIWSAVSTAFNNIKTTVTSVVSGIWTTVSNTFNNIKNAITNSINAAKNAVSNAINAIKNLFNFHITWPHIPLPHFSVSGSANPLDWLKGGLPKISISWYAKAMRDGMILNSPTIFGYQNGSYLAGGEAGAEVVVGANSLYSMIQSAMGSRSISAPINLSVVVNGNVDDSDRFARQLGDRLANLITRNSEVFR